MDFRHQSGRCWDKADVYKSLVTNVINYNLKITVVSTGILRYDVLVVA